MVMSLQVLAATLRRVIAMLLVIRGSLVLLVSLMTKSLQVG